MADTPRRYKGRTTDHPEPWEEVFLTHYAEYGGKVLSAKTAGVTWPYVKKRIDASPVFAEKFAEAEELLGDQVEKMMLKLGREGGKTTQFMPLMAMLRALRPSKFNDKLQVSGAVAHLQMPVPQAEITALLRAMISDVTPETRAQIAGGEVIDVEGRVVDAPDRPHES